MSKLNRTCTVCGKKYRYCPSCYEDRNMENWHIMFHDENCKDIFTILTDNFNGHLSDSETLKKIQKCDLSNEDSFYKEIKDHIDRIQSTAKNKAKKYEDKNVSDMQETV